MNYNNPHGYKIRSWIGQKEGIRQAVRALASALHDPSEGMKAMSRVGVSLSRRQRFVVWALSHINKVWAQRFILWILDRAK